MNRDRREVYLSDVDEPVALEHAVEHVEPESTPEAKDGLIENEVLHEERYHPEQISPVSSEEWLCG